MSTVHFVVAAAVATLVLLEAPASWAQGGPIGPFKDDLFSRQTVLESSDGGAFEVIDYQELRDINKRDQEPERRVRQAYVDLGVRRSQADETLALSGGPVDVTRAGPASHQGFTVIFVHGRGGDQRLGANDYSFGGNFNRLKNLTMRNGGTYYSVSMKSFDAAGAMSIGSLISHAAGASGGRPVIVVCASMGGLVCQHLARNGEAARNLAAMVLLGGPPDPDLATTPFGKLKKPIYLAHGSADKVYSADAVASAYRKLYSAGLPVHLDLFRSGTHGTPIRMVDWRKALNFVLTRG